MKVCPKCHTSHDLNGKFCSRSCANSRGPRTEDFKNKVRSKLVGRKVSDSTRAKLSGDNHPKRKGRNLPPIVITKECLYCNNNFQSKYGKQKYCSQKCYSLYVKSSKTAFENYRNECAFKFNVYDYPQEFDLALVEQYGFYSASNKGNNLNGISRDHKISVRYGFDNAIEPKLISHPANCQLMIQSENSAKKTKCSISIDELKDLIKKWDEKYGVVTER